MSPLPLSYLAYLDPLDWREPAWVRWVEWLLTWGLLLVGAVWSQVGGVSFQKSN